MVKKVTGSIAYMQQHTGGLIVPKYHWACSLPIPCHLPGEHIAAWLLIGAHSWSFYICRPVLTGTDIYLFGVKRQLDDMSFSRPLSMTDSAGIQTNDLITDAMPYPTANLAHIGYMYICTYLLD